MNINKTPFIAPRRALIGLVVTLAVLCSARLVAAAPDISGPWELLKPVPHLTTLTGANPPLTASGQALYAKNKADREADPMKSCLPPGIPRALMQPGFPFSIVQGQEYLGMMLQWNHLPRIVYMNQPHFENIGPEYLGQSVAHWQGNELIIDSTGYNDKSWLDDSGLPHSDSLHTVERLRLRSPDRLEDTIQFEDPAIYSVPWTARLEFRKRAGTLIQEDYCLGRTGQGHTVVK
jgi:hypothetical protein